MIVTRILLLNNPDYLTVHVNEDAAAGLSAVHICRNKSVFTVYDFNRTREGDNSSACKCPCRSHRCSHRQDGIAGIHIIRIPKCCHAEAVPCLSRNLVSGNAYHAETCDRILFLERSLYDRSVRQSYGNLLGRLDDIYISQYKITHTVIRHYETAGSIAAHIGNIEPLVIGSNAGDCHDRFHCLIRYSAKFRLYPRVCSERFPVKLFFCRRGGRSGGSGTCRIVAFRSCFLTVRYICFRIRAVTCQLTVSGVISVCTVSPGHRTPGILLISFCVGRTDCIFTGSAYLPVLCAIAGNTADDGLNRMLI